MNIKSIVQASKISKFTSLKIEVFVEEKSEANESRFWYLYLQFMCKSQNYLNPTLKAKNFMSLASGKFKSIFSENDFEDIAAAYENKCLSNFFEEAKNTKGSYAQIVLNDWRKSKLEAYKKEKEIKKFEDLKNISTPKELVDTLLFSIDKENMASTKDYFLSCCLLKHLGKSEEAKALKYNEKMVSEKSTENILDYFSVFDLHTIDLAIERFCKSYQSQEWKGVVHSSDANGNFGQHNLYQIKIMHSAKKCPPRLLSERELQMKGIEF